MSKESRIVRRHQPAFHACCPSRVRQGILQPAIFRVEERVKVSMLNGESFPIHSLIAVPGRCSPGHISQLYPTLSLSPPFLPSTYANINMVSFALLSFYILWTLCALPVESLWLFRRSNGHLNRAANGPGETIRKSQGSEPDHNFTYSVPSPRVITPTLTSQSMVVTSVVAAYEVCNTPGSNTSSTCSTVFRNITTSLCSTVLTAWFTSVTVTDCNQNITFSTQTSYSLATATTIPSTPSALPASQALSQGPTATTFVQSVVYYFIAPWQSLAANTPTNIAVLICKFDQDDSKICHEIKEVWVVHTENVPVTSTSTVSISTSFTAVSSFLKLM